MKEEVIKECVIDAWDIYANGMVVDKGNKKEDSRSKIKSMAGALRQFTDPEDAVLHFIKYIEYMLPRSDFSKTLEQILKKITAMREKGLTDEEMLERLQYTIGYLAWTADSLDKLDSSGRRGMIEAEFSMIGLKGKEEEYLRKIESSGGEDERRRRY